MRTAEGKTKLLEAEGGQLKAKKATIERQLNRSSKVLAEHSKKEQKEKAKELEQRQLIREAKHRK